MAVYGSASRSWSGPSDSRPWSSHAVSWAVSSIRAAALPAVSLQRAEAAPAEPSEERSSGIVPARSTYFLPSVLRNNEQKGAAWTDSITVRDGELILAVPVYKTKGKGPIGFSIAKS